MLCKNPYMRGVQPCGCGQCLNCRINRGRLWSHRIMLESRAHQENAFVTLTYRDDQLPTKDGGLWHSPKTYEGTLRKYDAQRWLKRLRKQLSYPIRYFLVGEYGDNTQRPHYHVAVFGFPSCVYGRTRPMVKSCCGPCETIKKTWGKGSIQVGQLNNDSAQYISGYVTKKWTKEDSWNQKLLNGRSPEFARMSLNPGIGATAIKSLISFTEPTPKGKYVKSCIDAPVVLRNSGSILPLGRYLRRKWREAIGRSPDTPESVSKQYQSELQGLYSKDKEAQILAGTPSCFINPKTIYSLNNKQKIKNLDAKLKIVQNRRTI